MKQKTIAVLGIIITAALMLLLAYTVYLFMDSPNSTVGMMSMALVSTGMMTFLIIFGLIYTKPQSDSERFMELYGDEINKGKKE